MKFGDALERLKLGSKIARAGWADKQQFVYLNKGSAPSDQPQVPDFDPELFEAGMADTITRMPNINKRGTGGAIETGWSASQTDLLAEDWGVIG